MTSKQKKKLAKEIYDYELLRSNDSSSKEEKAYAES
jgi:hypothetical protein